MTNKNKVLDWSLYDQIEQHKQEKEAAEQCMRIRQAQRIGSISARIQIGLIVIALLMALIMIPEPLKRWG